jgi:hypothetical protein
MASTKDSRVVAIPGLRDPLLLSHLVDLKQKLALTHTRSARRLSLRGWGILASCSLTAWISDACGFSLRTVGDRPVRATP